MIDAGKIAAILLAAGQSRRFGGGDKLIAEVKGEPLVMHAARRLVELAPAQQIAVCSSAQGDVASLLAATGFQIVVNPKPELGLSRSLACGIGAVAPEPQAALICLADMPFVGLGHLQALLAHFDPQAAPVVASARGGIAMPPALFSRTQFERLQQAQGDKGGRELLAKARLVEAKAAELVDIDVPEDLGRKIEHRQ